MTEDEPSKAVGVELALANALQNYYAWRAGQGTRDGKPEPFVMVPLHVAAEIATAAMSGGTGGGRDTWGRDFKQTMERSRRGVIAPSTRAGS